MQKYAGDDCLSYLLSIDGVFGPKRIVTLVRVYEDVIKMYCEDDILQEYPLCIPIEGEVAIDAGVGETGYVFKILGGDIWLII